MIDQATGVEYNIFTLGFDKFLTKSPINSNDLPLPAPLQSNFFAPSPSSIPSGELTGNLTIVDGFLKSDNYVQNSSGWKLSSTGGEFNFAVSVHSLDIPDISTANSFHTDNSGNSWWGCNVADFVSNHNNATAYILNTGVTKFATALSGASIVANGSTLVLYDDSATGNPVTGATAQIVFADTSDATQQILINKRKSIYSNDDNVLETYAAKAPNGSGLNYLFYGRKGDDVASGYFVSDVNITTKGRFELDHYNSSNFATPHPLWFLISANDTSNVGDPNFGKGLAGATRQVMFSQSDPAYTSLQNFTNYLGGGFQGFGYYADASYFGGGAGTQLGGVQMYLDIAGIHNYDFVDFSNASDFGGRATVCTDSTLGYGVYVAEPYWNFTRVDPNSRFTVASGTEIDFTALPTNETSYIYKDMSTSYFSSDFTHNLQVKITSVNNANGGENFAVWTLANDLGDYTTLVNASKSFLTVLFNNPSNGVYWLQAIESVSGNLYTDHVVISLNTDYYLTITRDETVGTYGTLYCYVYSNSARTTLVGTATITLHAKSDFRYLYAIQSDNNANAHYNTGYVKNLVLVSNPSDIIIPSQTAVLGYIKSIPPVIGNWKTGTFTHDMSTTTTNTIAHGLSRIPKIVRINGILGGGNSFYQSFGVYDGTTQNCVYIGYLYGGSNGGGSDTTHIIGYFDVLNSGATNLGTVSVDGTNISITWSKSGSPDKTMSFTWEAT